MWTPVEQQQHRGGKAVESDHTDRKLKSALRSRFWDFFGGEKEKSELKS